MQRPGDHNCQSGEQGANPQTNRYFADGSYAAIKQHNINEANRDGHQQCRSLGHAGPDVVCISGEADVARGYFQRPAQNELPDKQKCHEPAECFAAVTLSQVQIGTSRARHGRAKFAPNHPVRNRDQNRDNPTQHCLGTTERRH